MHRHAELPQVMLVKHAGKYYALKTLHKAQIIEMGLHVSPAPHVSVRASEFLAYGKMLLLQATSAAGLCCVEALLLTLMHDSSVLDALS